MTAIRGRIITGVDLLADGIIAFDGGTVMEVTPAGQWNYPGVDVVDTRPSGVTLVPGFVDVHCHGGGGAGFHHDPLDASRVVRFHRSRGTTTQLASLVSAPGEVLRRQVAALAPLVHTGDLAGLHLEGPFLSVWKCGAHDPAAIIPGDLSLLSELLDVGGGAIRSQTFAPETAHAASIARLLHKGGAVPCIGHTSADSATTRRVMAASSGQWGATHLFNAMPALHHRDPGPVASCLSAAARVEMVVEIIGDGVHLSDDTVRMVFDLVGPGQVALVTDAMAAAGMPDGDYALGGLDVRVDDGVARLSTGDHYVGDVPAIAGGTATLAEVVRRTVISAGVDLVSAVQSATHTPATLFGLKAGHLRPGYPADMVALDEDLRAVAVWHRGERIKTSPEQC
ncbi:amidohydrolase family protein [Hoyosella rhizosphaerae]|nr:amidohydrolase family protein [Hoyosella rhizosphaerae]